MYVTEQRILCTPVVKTRYNLGSPNNSFWKGKENIESKMHGHNQDTLHYSIQGHYGRDLAGLLTTNNIAVVFESHQA